jgi:hypothetical protein
MLRNPTTIFVSLHIHHTTYNRRETQHIQSRRKYENVRPLFIGSKPDAACMVVAVVVTCTLKDD